MDNRGHGGVKELVYGAKELILDLAWLVLAWLVLAWLVLAWLVLVWLEVLIALLNRRFEI